MDLNNQFMFSNPVITNAGQQFIDHYSEKIAHESSGWIDRNLRPFFAVDDSYVMKKLSILLFPFAHRQWFYSPDEQYSGPKFNVNAPDLYIPLMAFITYVLGAGYMLGLKDKFSPEQLGYLSSSALVCLSTEVCLLVIIFHFCNVRCWFNFIHYIAFCSYKFVPIVLSMLISLLFKTTGYYITIVYSTLALGYYMIRSFHVAIEAGSQVHDNIQPASRLGDYIIGGFSLAQPLFMMWLSHHLVP